METKLQSKQQYPRFIQNKPCGIDKFDGGSQERLAKTIARHFCQNDSLDEECTLPFRFGHHSFLYNLQRGRHTVCGK